MEVSTREVRFEVGTPTSNRSRDSSKPATLRRAKAGRRTVSIYGTYRRGHILISSSSTSVISTLILNDRKDTIFIFCRVLFIETVCVLSCARPKLYVATLLVSYLEASPTDAHLTSIFPSSHEVDGN